jgi:hypothetical protein
MKADSSQAENALMPRKNRRTDEEKGVFQIGRSGGALNK